MSMALPKFLVIGAQKCGTTSLHFYLDEHPDIFLPAVKETTFFSDDKLFSKGVTFYSRTFFSSYKGQKTIGEVCPQYLASPSASFRIFQMLGKIKLLVILRNPTERAYSHYWMKRVRQQENRTFEEAIDGELKEFESAKMLETGQWLTGPNHYLSCGLYARQLIPYIDLFGLDAVCFLSFEDLTSDPSMVLRRICTFLGINRSYKFSGLQKKYNISYRPKSVLLENFMRNRNLLKGSLKRVCPESIRLILRDRLIKWNTVPVRRAAIGHRIKRRIDNFYRDENMRLRELLSGADCYDF